MEESANEENIIFENRNGTKTSKFKGVRKIYPKTNINGTPGFTWSSHSYTLGHITSNFKLPRVVKCSVGSCSLDWDLLHFDLSQPLLLHSLRTVKKIKAAVMRLDRERGSLVDTGGHVVIPMDYNGWFTLLEDPTEQCLPSSTLESMIEEDTDQVLVAKSISCLCLTDTGKGNKQSERKQISSGEILHVKRTDVEGSITQPSSKYLVCTDEKEKEMFVPVSQNGKFYKVKNSYEKDGLFQIKDVIEKQHKLPLKIRHVIGDMPAFTSEYSSYLRCYDIIEESTAVASTMDEELVLLELQISTPLKFYLALNEATAKHNTFYSDALQNCESESDDYVRSIKFSFTLAPENYSVCNSVVSLASTESFYTDSEIGDEEANSEFTIKWDPTGEELLEKVRAKLEAKPGPKIFNSSIIKPKNSDETDENKWNEEPDTV